jgi:hypothetical protein
MYDRGWCSSGRIRREVARLVVVEADVDRVGVVQVGLDVVDERERSGTPRELPRLAPRLPAVLGDMDQPVVGART